jgi:microcompartment protein CcmL/EutN
MRLNDGRILWDMDLKQSLGIIELPNFCDAVEALDIMLKSSGVGFVTAEKKLGGRLVTIIVSGSASAVEHAVESAKKTAGGKKAAPCLLLNPHPETLKVIEMSSKKYIN